MLHVKIKTLQTVSSVIGIIKGGSFNRIAYFLDKHLFVIIAHSRSVLIPGKIMCNNKRSTKVGEKSFSSLVLTYSFLLVGVHSAALAIVDPTGVLLHVPQHQLSVNTTASDYVRVGWTEFKTGYIIRAFKKQLRNIQLIPLMS